MPVKNGMAPEQSLCAARSFSKDASPTMRGRVSAQGPNALGATVMTARVTNNSVLRLAPDAHGFMFWLR